MEKKITPNSTKNDILEAYNEALKQLEQQRSGQPKEVKENEEREKLVKSAVSVNKEGIIKQIASLKIGLNSELEKVEEALISESKKLNQIQEAIQIQEQRLNDLYNINATADSVSAMLALQREKKEAFEKETDQKRRQFEDEMSETRLKWEKEKKEAELLIKEEKEKLQKQRKRDEEEYVYNLEMTRKKDNDQYIAKKNALENELKEKKDRFEAEIKSREQAVISAESELKELKERVALFPQQLDEAVRTATKETTEKLQTSYKFESQLKTKEFEGEVKLRDQEIANLKSKIKDLETQSAQLANKAEQADKSAKDIAIRAIESSSNYKIIDRVKDSREEGNK